MALLQTFHLEHLPPHHDIHVALYSNLQNATFLHQQLLSGNTDFEYAFIDASVIISKTHALAAAYRALNDFLESRLRSRNVHSEIVFSLSPNNNIAESFRRFGISPSTTNLLVVKVSTESQPVMAETVQRHLGREVLAEQVPFEDEVLSGMTDLGRVRKIYKLNAGSGVGKKAVKVDGDALKGFSKLEDRDGMKELEVLVLGSMALRGLTN